MRRPLRLILIALISAPLISAPAFADGGMWTFHDFPRQLLEREYGFEISSAWLDRVRTATVRLSNCTAAFVSGSGLAHQSPLRRELPGRALDCGT